MRRAEEARGSDAVGMIEWVLTGAGGLAALYACAWVASRAFFDNKVDYNRRLLRQLEQERDRC